MFTVYGIIFVITCITLLHMLYKACLEESESVSADHHDKKSVFCIGWKNPDHNAYSDSDFSDNSDFIGKTYRIIIRILIEITK